MTMFSVRSLILLAGMVLFLPWGGFAQVPPAAAPPSAAPPTTAPSPEISAIQAKIAKIQITPGYT